MTSTYDTGEVYVCAKSGGDPFPIYFSGGKYVCGGCCEVVPTPVFTTTPKETQPWTTRKTASP